MKKARVRVFLAFMFLVMAQYACSFTGVTSVISYTLEAFAYEDLNANGSQDPNEAGMEGIQIYLDDTKGTTQQDGKITFVATGDREVCPISYAVTPPTGYKVTEQINPSWNCTKNSLGFYEQTRQFASVRVGVAPINTITILKTASPTTFSAAGETITYTYTVKNLSQWDTPSPLELRDDKLGTITCPKNQLGRGETMSCSATYTTTSQDVSRGSITNAVSMFYKGVQFGPTVSATVTLAIPSSSPQPAPAITSTVLTGQFATYCDPNRAINFRLINGIDPVAISNEFSSGNLRLAVNGTNISGTCRISSDNRILNCQYPAGITSYPVPVVLNYNGNELIQIQFFGEVCSSSSSGGGEENPLPTACQVDLGSLACFCETNPEDLDCP